ncbi:MAG: hypothetical protein SangKO_060690 [Sandaracinaceae bacterium]
MNRLALTVACLLSLAGCAMDAGASPDAEDAVGVVLGGKADGGDYSECELREVVSHLNEGASAEELLEAGVHVRAAENLAAHRDGEDGLFGTEDDDLFADIAEVDEVSWVGPVALQQLVAIVTERCEAPPVEVDPWAEARDPELALVSFPEDMAAPESYQYPRVDGFGLGGTEFWQQWPDGHSPTFSFSDGTDHGRRCMQASAIRFETIMADPPESMVRLREESNWSGRFFNWNDDFTLSEWSDGRGARLWAWRTGLVKWISQTNRDGTCWLPTREMVERVAEDCLLRGERSDGEIQGCSAR